jgi:hypothetical protein
VWECNAPRDAVGTFFVAKAGRGISVIDSRTFAKTPGVEFRTSGAIFSKAADW